MADFEIPHHLEDKFPDPINRISKRTYELEARLRRKIDLSVERLEPLDEDARTLALAYFMGRALFLESWLVYGYYGSEGESPPEETAKVSPWRLVAIRLAVEEFLEHFI